MINEKLRFTEEQIKHADSVNLIDYAHKKGYQLLKVSPRSYKIVGHGGLFIHYQGHMWHHFPKDTGGGAIQFVMHMEGKTWVEAIKQLLYGSYSFVPCQYDRKCTEQKSKGTFVLPEKNSTFRHVFEYLTEGRRLDNAIVNDFIKADKIYEINTIRVCLLVLMKMVWRVSHLIRLEVNIA
jgi:hypothetical protein